MNNNNDFIELFEQRLCEFTGAPYAVAVDRCTNAILLALESLPVTDILQIPKQTYISVPMTLINHGYDIELVDLNWIGGYNIAPTNVWDCAQGFEKDMYVPGQIQCLSFQQKKRLAIGKGGAILLDDEKLANHLRRLRHDGRNSAIPVVDEDPDDLIVGYHMYMSPDEAARGILLLNQLDPNYKCGSSDDYPDMSKMRCFQ